MPKICQILNWAIKKLQEAGIESAGLDAEILLVNILNQRPHPRPSPCKGGGVVHPSPLNKGRDRERSSIGKSLLYAHPELELTKSQEKKYKKFIARRSKNEPVAYILGQKEFFGLDFWVNKNVLIPRPETEMMVEEVINQLTINNKQSRVLGTKKQKIIIIDVGTGSGCLIISILKNLLVANCWLLIDAVATDISERALAVAKKNARLHGLTKKIRFIKSDLLNFLLSSRGPIKSDRWDLEIPSAPSGLQNDMKIIVTANLPYLPEKIYRRNYQGLKFEPRTALVAKNNGLFLYEKLLKQIKQLTINNKQLTIFLEILPFQKPLLEKLIKKHLPKANVKFKKDLAKKWRVAVIKI
ncbi:MAG: peptide chain release factor N(5)-glutamine methyltransferase [Patescibacteria group bacterium]|nr:peptide chain release factor N(5)-glutamine methyltransferase [Patescibacteria group bacterium]